MNALKFLVAVLLFCDVAIAQIPSLCNTGETYGTVLGCSGVLVTPNPTGGGPNRDGNWGIAYPYPSTLSPILGPCDLGFVRAWVDTPLLQGPSDSWLPNGSSNVSEWITPFDGEGNQSPGWFIYRTGFHVPLVLPDGSVPTGLVINGRLSSDNQTYGFALASPASGGSCALVEGLPLPINPTEQFGQWMDFSFTSPIAITPDSHVSCMFSFTTTFPVANPTLQGFALSSLTPQPFIEEAATPIARGYWYENSFVSTIPASTSPVTTLINSFGEVIVGKFR